MPETTTTTATVEQRQRLADAVRQSGELAALLGAMNQARPCPLLMLAIELAHRLDDGLEEIALAA